MQPHIRQVSPGRKDTPKVQPHYFRLGVAFIFFFVLGISLLRGGSGHASALSPYAIKSSLGDYCLSSEKSKVDLASCGDDSAQVWTVGDVNIKQGSDCLTLNGSQLETDACNGDANQVWLKDRNSIMNPNTQDCLSATVNNDTSDVNAVNCKLTTQSQIWLPGTANQSFNCNTGPEGDRVACYAVKEWQNWQSGVYSHNSLLNTYTDGAPYEEWCADFVSYIYKEAGYPFTQGDTNGWDENVADNIQYMGLNTQQSSNYVPQAGDVAYFDYPGGHVEIVVSGGQHPTFIYGDSATIDPTTGNGQMEANTITSQPNLGSVQYYMSP